MSQAGGLWRRLGFGWWGLLLLCLARGLAAGDYPPLVAEGEVIDDPEGIIAGIMPREAVDAVAFSPDGRLLASASGNTVYLWDTATGAAVRTLEGHGNGVNAVVFSPNGSLLASVSWDRTVRLWDPATGAAVRTLEGHGNSVTAVAFSRDGRLLASASVDKTVRLWDPTTGAPVRTLAGHPGPVAAVAFSPDGHLLASASWDKTVRLWDPTGAAVRILEGHQDWVTAVAFSPDGRLLASAAEDRTVRLWDPATGVPVRTLEGHQDRVLAVAFSPDGRLLASASADKTVRLWDTVTGAPVRTLEGHQNPVIAAAFSPDGRLLASASWDQTVRLWDAATGAPARTLAGHPGPVAAVGFSPGGHLLASASWDKTVRLWDPATGAAVRTLEGHQRSVNAVAFSPDGRLLASAAEDMTVRLWDPATGVSVRTLEGHQAPVNAVAFSPDGRLLASASGAIIGDNSVRLWDPATGIPVRTLSGHREVVTAVAFSPDGRLLASAAGDGTVRQWDPATGAPVRTLTEHQGGVNAVAFSPDGRLLASAGADPQIVLRWNSATGSLWGGRYQEELHAVAFSPDGRLLASASWDETENVRLWDLRDPATGSTSRTLAGHQGWVNAVAFSPDGRLLASASADGTVRLWDPKSRVCELILAGGRDGTWVACRPVEGRCWRHDDGSLAVRKGLDGLLTPVTPPAGAEPARLEIVALPASNPALATGDGRSTEVTVRVVNQGSAPAYWLRIHQTRDFGDPLLYTPPPVVPRLDPGQSVDLTGQVSYLAAWTDPQAHAGRLRLQLDHAHGTAGTVEVPIRATTPQIAVVAEPELVPGDAPALSVMLQNKGGQDLEQAEVRARLTGLAADLPRQSQPLVKAGADLPLSFALPKGAKVDKDSRLTLIVDERSYPPHDWTFADRPIRLPTPPWQLYAGLAALVLTLSALLWSLRQYTHPLTRRLAADPAALAGLGLAQLERARTLLRRTRRLGSVLAAGGVQGRWLDRAIRFRGESAEGQVRWLAERLGAGWQRLEGLGDGGAMAQFELALGDGFPLRLSACRVAFPPADWPAQDVLTLLGTGGDRPCLVLGRSADQCADLSRRCRSPETWWVAPQDGELSALLLAAEPVDAFARLIARYVKVARISPYQTSLGVRKESGFFGRTRILSDILNRGDLANYLVVGGRQLGKSSLLLALQRRFGGRKGIDCRYLSVGLASIESRLALALGLPAATPLPDLLRQLAQVPPGTRRVLLLDEADAFVAADAARGYVCLNGFRSLSDEGRCHFILAGFWSLYRSASFDYQSPIKNFAETIQIGALEPEACRDLVTKPMAALGLTYADAGMVERILERTGGRANLIAILCDQMLQGLGLEQRVLTEPDLERALVSRSLRSALEDWGELTADPSAARLDRVIVYGLIGQEHFRLAVVLDLLGGLSYQAAPEAIKESLTRLELAFLIGRDAAGYRWQVPLWRDLVLAEEPERMLRQEVEQAVSSN